MDDTIDNLTDNERGLLNRARAFCAASEQCRSAVRHKLTDWGADEAEADAVLERLVEEEYIDERRYVRAYCESKMLRARWGERKVRYELMHKGIPHSVIDEGIALIEPEGRDEAVRTVAQKKMATLSGLDAPTARRRLMSFLAQRGFGMEEIGTVVAEIMKEYTN